MKNISHTKVDDIYRLIGRNVAHWRKHRGISQLDLALEMGLKSVGLVSVAEIYHQRKYFNLEHLCVISQILDVPITVFFEEVEC